MLIARFKALFVGLLTFPLPALAMRELSPCCPHILGSKTSTLAETSRLPIDPCTLLRRGSNIWRSWMFGRLKYLMRDSSFLGIFILHWTFELLDFWTFELLKCWTFELWILVLAAHHLNYKSTFVFCFSLLFLNINCY